MLKKLLFIMAVTSMSFSLPAQENPSICLDNSPVALKPYLDFTWNMSVIPFKDLQAMLKNPRYQLSSEAIAKIMATLKCMKEMNKRHKNILAFIDFSLPSNQKRLWIFDLKKKTLLFHTYVSHGIKSGALISNQFSNKNNSKSSSIGVYVTDQAYYGRHGLSLKLQGLERSFNDNAYNRFVVMHGSWYVNEDFIKRYGRPGRSWGCPAVPTDLTKAIIHTIEDDALFVAYYPSDRWFASSKYLNCDAVVGDKARDAQVVENTNSSSDLIEREPIVFADINKNDKREENEPIVVMSAADYENTFHCKAPLTRMLRRQINKTEYIALSQKEFDALLKEPKDSGNPEAKGPMQSIAFVIPVVKMLRGYYATEMNFVNLGQMKEVSAHQNPSDASGTTAVESYTMTFKNKPAVIFKASERFIRWLGL